MAGEEPLILPVGTEVSAKYRGAFCEAKVKKIVKCVKCKVTLSEPRSQIVVLDEDVKGNLKPGAKVEVKHPETGQYVEAVLNKLTDCSMYTVVFDDGDENTLRRTQLCLKGEKHFVKSETLDQLPLTHPEHFGTPVMKSYKGTKRRRSNMAGGAGASDSDSESESSECSTPRKRIYKGRTRDLLGRVLCMEIDDRKKTTWVPVLAIIPSASDIELKSRDHLIVKSFKDSRIHSVSRKDTKDFARDMAIKNEDKSLKPAMEKALAYFDSRELPSNWDREELLGIDSDEEDESDTSDDEPSEEKDHFVAQLYKFMDDRDTPINKAPAIGARDLNLYRLFKLVLSLGGYNKVTNLMKWKMVYSKMNLPPSSNAYNQIKTAYKKYLHAYEDFYRKLGSTMGNRPGRTRHSSGRSLMPFRERELGQPKSPRTEKKKEDKCEEEKEDDKKTEEKKEDEKGKSKEPEKKEIDVKNKKQEERKVTTKEDVDADVDSPRKRRSRVTGEKKAEEKVKDDEKTTKRVTREEAAKSKDDSKGKEDERSRRSTNKKPEEIEEKEETAQKRRSMSTRKKGTKAEEKEESKKKSQEETISDGGPDEESDDGQDEEEEPTPPPPKEEPRKDSRRKELSLGTKLKVRYGRGRNQKIYEAKVVESEQEAGSTHYLVHYAGWNNRYDEWVQRDRIVAVVSDGTDGDKRSIAAKKLISPKSGAPKKIKRPAGASSNPLPKSDAKSTKAKAQVSTPGNQKARPTRSSGPEVSTTVLPTRRSRRGSGIGDNASDITSHVSESDSDEEESNSEEKKVDTDDTDSLKMKSERSEAKAKPQTKMTKAASSKKDKESPSSESDSESSEPAIKEMKPKGKYEVKSHLKVKSEIKPEPSPASTEKSDDEEIEQTELSKKPGKSTPNRPNKGMVIKAEEPAASPSTTGIVTEESMDLSEEGDNKTSELLAKDEDAQSEDDILKDLKVNHHIDMGDILVYPDSDMSIAPPKTKTPKETARGKRRKSTDSVDDVSRQDSLDTVAYGYDIQDAVQNILDQLDEGDDSDDLPFLTETKGQRLFSMEGERKEEAKCEKPKKEKKSEKEKVKEKGEKSKVKTPKKAEKLTADDMKQESDTEKEKKHEGDKKKKVKKKKVKKKLEGKDSEKEGGRVLASPEMDSKPAVPKSEPDSVMDYSVEPLLVNEEITSPPQLAAVTPSKEKDDIVKRESGSLELSPLPPKLKAERFDTNIPGDKSDDEVPASFMDVLPPAVPEVDTAMETTLHKQLQPSKLQSPSQPEPLPSIPPMSLTSELSSPPSVTASVTLQPETASPPAKPCPSLSASPAIAPISFTASSPPTTAVTPSVPVSTPSSLPSSSSPTAPTQQAPTTLFDNTPPETPEGSPEAPHLADITKSPAHIEEPTACPTSPNPQSPILPVSVDTEERTKTVPAEPSPVILPPGGESPNACDTSTISNGSEGSSGNMPSSEDSTEGSAVTAPTTSTKRKMAEESQPPPKKRKRSSKRGSNVDKVKTTPKLNMSDSDEAPESGSASPKASEAQAMTPSKNTPSKSKTMLPSQSPAASGSSGNSPRCDEPRPPRPSKYNFNLEEGKYLEGDQRIYFIMEKLQEIRKIYMSLKAEVACIDRRRKRAKRREKEGTALALASLANS